MDIIKIMLDTGEEKEVNGIFYLYNSKYYLMYTEKEIDENGYVILYLVEVGKEIKNTPEGPIDTGYMIGMEVSDTEEWKNVQASITKIVEDKKDSKQSPEIQYLPITMLNTLKIKSRKKFRLMKDIVENYFHLEISNTTNDAFKITSDSQTNTSLATINLDQTLIPTQEGLQQTMPVPSTTDATMDTMAPIESVQSIPVTETVSLENNSIGLQQPVLNSIDISIPQQTTNEVIDENTPLIAEPQQNEIIIDYRSRFFEEQEKNKNLELRISELERKLEEIKALLNM